MTCRRRTSLAKRGICAGLAAALFASSITGAAAHPYLFYKAIAFAAGNAKLVGVQASRAYRKAQRVGTCEERRARLLAVLPDAQRLGRASLTIYDRGAEMKALALKTKVLGDGATAYYEVTGQRYAEMRVDQARRQVVITFRGTRLSVRGDLEADVLGLIGIQPGYYKWAAELVAGIARAHPGMDVVTTGHSLGGGLAVYAALRNPGVRAFVFNPAGLSWRIWLTAGHAERERLQSAPTVISSRNGDRIEPVTALSLSKRSVLPGHLYFIDTQGGNPIVLHSMTALQAKLDRLATNGADGDACNGVLGAAAP